MGLYNQFSTSPDSVIAADESYVGVEGCMRAIEEAYENEHAIFNALIGVDFAEAYHKVNESVVSEGQLEALTESTVGDVWKKVVEFVKKAWAKVKGIIDSLITKVKLMFTRDGKTLVNKYGKTVRSNVTKGACDKMKFKWAKGLSAPESTLTADIEGLELFSFTKAKLSGAKNPTISAAASSSDPEDIKKVRNTTLAPFTAEQKTEHEEKAFGHLLKGSPVSASEFSKEFAAKLDDEVEETEGLTTTILDTIVEILSGYSKFVTALEKEKTALDKNFKEISKAAEEVEKAQGKAASNNTAATPYTTKNQMAASSASHVIALVTIITKVTNTYYAAVSGKAKKTFGLARAAFVKAATYKAKKKDVEESALLTEALLEASDYEVEAMWDNDLDGSIFY